MSVAPLRLAPIDNSGGIMHVRYLNGDRIENIQRIHLNTNVASAVETIFANYAALAADFYDDAWTVQLTALEGVAGGLPFPMPCPAVDDVPGTGSTATTGIAGLTETIFQFDLDTQDPDEGQYSARLRFVGIGGSAPGRQIKVSGTAGGTAEDRALVAFVTNPTNHFVGHSGIPLIAPATKNTPLWKRERRKSMRKR